MSIAHMLAIVAHIVCVLVQSAAARAQELKAKGINPRTGKPYVRGGAYSSARGSACSSAGKAPPTDAQVKKEARAAEASRAAAAKSTEDQKEIARLRNEVARLTEALKSSEEKIELAKKAAAFEAGQAAAEQLLKRYRDGLRDGASLSRGGVCNLASESGAGSTPSSAAGGFGNSPGFGF